LRGGLGVRGGEGGIWNIKSSIGNSPSVSTLETANQSKRHLSSEVGARIPSTFSHSFFCERDIELWELRLPGLSAGGREERKRSKARRRGIELWPRSDLAPNPSSIGMRLLSNLVLDVDRVIFWIFSN
jgi:hypothetical protein